MLVLRDLFYSDLMLRRRVLALLLLVLPVMAQDKGGDPRNFDASAFGQRVELGPNWLFAPGDNPAYASPTLDDSNWRVVASRRDANDDPMYHDISFCWFRIHVRLRPTAHGTVTLAVENLYGPYQVFVNGILIGSNGTMASHDVHTQLSLIPYAIPQELLVLYPGKLVVAIRCSLPPRYIVPFGPLAFAEFYLEGKEAAERDVSYAAAHLVTVPAVLAATSLLAGLVSLSLYVALRKQTEYFAMAIFLLANCLYWGLDVWTSLTVFSPWRNLLFDFVRGLAIVALIEFVRLVLRIPKSRWLLALEGLAFLFRFVRPVVGYLSGASASTVLYISTSAVQLFLAFLLFRGWRRSNQEARLMLPSILLYSLSNLNWALGYVAFSVHLSSSTSLLEGIHLGSYFADVTAVVDLAFFVTILLFIVLRTIRIARDRAQVANEIKAAQTVQQLLLARTSEPTPGFEVESVYQPASETGGDFFLISPASDNSLIAIVGDVSGKGLTAAMRVSLIIGVLRRETSREPSEILNGLNLALLMQSEMGFTTACCVRLQRDGSYTVANAGHLGPYIDGAEVPTAPQLPLGLSSDSEYTQVTGHLPPGKKLVLLSDGVVEARSAKGELYGFERTAKLTLMPAQEIADEAKRFGQDDDITVLSIACCA